MAKVNYSICKGRLEKAKNNLFQLAICLVMLSKTYPPPFIFILWKKIRFLKLFRPHYSVMQASGDCVNLLLHFN
jgi:hypothetical protein